MTKQTYALIICLLVLGANRLYCQQKDHFATFFISNQKKPTSRITIKMAGAAGTETMTIFCSDGTDTSPCAVASSLPPKLPKCDPATCLNNMLFSKESNGKYKLAFKKGAMSYAVFFDPRGKELDNILGRAQQISVEAGYRQSASLGSTALPPAQQKQHYG